VFKVFEQLNNFVSRYTSFLPTTKIESTSQKGVLENSSVNSSSTIFVAEEVEVVEEPLVSPQLGLKGNIDMIVKAKISSSDPNSVTRRALVGIELKTGHSQTTQNAHLAQLTLYILMMKSSYGVDTSQITNEICTTESGILLYLNNESIRAVNVAPSLSEIKSLICQRNFVAIEQVRATTPRGVTLLYEHDNDDSVSVR
jgi:CRISPR/Cas system-associated exonuclease Cas4 (RecB family)